MENNQFQNEEQILEQIQKMKFPFCNQNEDHDQNIVNLVCKSKDCQLYLYPSCIDCSYQENNIYGQKRHSHNENDHFGNYISIKKLLSDLWGQISEVKQNQSKILSDLDTQSKDFRILGDLCYDISDNIVKYKQGLIEQSEQTKQKILEFLQKENQQNLEKLQENLAFLKNITNIQTQNLGKSIKVDIKMKQNKQYYENIVNQFKKSFQQKKEGFQLEVTKLASIITQQLEKMNYNLKQNNDIEKNNQQEDQDSIESLYIKGFSKSIYECSDNLICGILKQEENRSTDTYWFQGTGEGVQLLFMKNILNKNCFKFKIQVKSIGALRGHLSIGLLKLKSKQIQSQNSDNDNDFGDEDGFIDFTQQERYFEKQMKQKRLEKQKKTQISQQNDIYDMGNSESSSISDLQIDEDEFDCCNNNRQHFEKYKEGPFTPEVPYICLLCNNIFQRNKVQTYTKNNFSGCQKNIGEGLDSIQVEINFREHFWKIDYLDLKYYQKMDTKLSGNQYQIGFEWQNSTAKVEIYQTEADLILN